jgi:hypothetical protein
LKLVSLLLQIAVLKALMALEGLEPTALDLSDEIALSRTSVRFIEARLPETVIRGRPWVPYRRLATITQGTRLAVRGTVPSRDSEGCNGKPWYAVHPFGFVCSTHARATEEPPELGPTLTVDEGRRLPFSYAIVRQDELPAYTSVEQIELDEPERMLAKKMSLTIRRSRDIGGARLLETMDGLLVPRKGVGWMGQGSEWQGSDLDGPPPGPLFGWALRKKTRVIAAPREDAEPVRTLSRREEVTLLDSADVEGRPRWWKVADGQWVRAKDINAVVIIEPPDGVLTDYRTRGWGNDQWIDVDVGQQVLVAYRGRRAVYATLISSGRRTPTPRGNYPIWAKVASMDMANQEYEDKPYMVQGVPWVLLFQGHNALHGAYWHDGFGRRRSHGCVNLAPLDARWIFEWVAPALPIGWTGFLPSDLQRGVVVHVRDSSREPSEQFTQDRKIGPPDAEEEKRKLEAALERRALEEAQAAQTPKPNPEHENLDQPPKDVGRIEAPQPPPLLPSLPDAPRTQGEPL